MTINIIIPTGIFMKRKKDISWKFNKSWFGNNIVPIKWYKAVTIHKSDNLNKQHKILL